MSNFEMRSLLLFSALLMGAAFAAQAQTSAPRLETGRQMAASTATTNTAAAPAAIAHNRTTAKELDAAFDRADVNHDGKLDRKEAERFPALVPKFEKIDANHDGFISREEFRRAASSH